MPRVAAFRGLAYSPDPHGGGSIPDRVRLPDEPPLDPGRVADVTDLVCPPYDVIDPDQRDELLRRHPHNAVRLELSAERDPYAAAAAQLAEWRERGVLSVADEPSVYYYSHATRRARDEPVVHGVLVRVLLEPWGASIRPHERTHSGPKQDRLELLRSTRTQLSPILAVYFDRSDRYRHVMARPWDDEWRARDVDGLLHQLARVTPDDRLRNYLARQQLFVADGHHRYETALAYQSELRAQPEYRYAPRGSLAADWVMAVLVNAELEEIEILPTHRVLRGLAPEARTALASLGGGDVPGWDVEPVAVETLEARLAEHAADETPVFGIVIGADAFIAAGKRDVIAERMQRERLSSAVRRLDLAVLHATVFADLLGIEATSAAEEGRLLYTKDAGEAVEMATSGRADACFLVRPTRIEDLAAVARAGDVMPQKSTYFYPKLLTGMVFYPLED